MASQLAPSAERGKVLFRIAGPELYRNNAFRVLGLLTDASPRQVNRREREISLCEQAEEFAYKDTVMPLKPVPTGDARRAAVQAITNPETRLLEELFWFWPCASSDGTDEAINALRQRQYPEAIEIWKAILQNRQHTVAAQHNLAVMSHIAALDLECRMLNKQDKSEDRTETDFRHHQWKEALKHWKTCLEMNDFWAYLSERVGELDDPRLTLDTVRAFRTTLPVMLLSINTGLMVTYSEENCSEAKWHSNLLMKSGFSSSDLDKALDEAAEPARSRIRNLCASAKQEINQNANLGVEVATRMLEQARKPLQVLSDLYNTGSSKSAAQVMQDEVTLLVLEGTIAYANETNDCQKAVQLLEQMAHTVTSEAIRLRIEKNLKIFRDNLLLETCWYCGKNKASKTAGIIVKMFGDVKRTPSFYGTEVTWQKLTLTVPRCDECMKKVQDKANYESSSCSLGCLGFLIISAPGAFLGDGSGLYVTIPVGLLVSGLFYYWKLKKYDSQTTAFVHSDYNSFPTIQEQLAKGWAFGEKPEGVQ